MVMLFTCETRLLSVRSKGTIKKEFTSIKVLILKDVYHIPEVRINIVSDNLLNKFIFKLIF